jgi:hypothetical protein
VRIPQLKLRAIFGRATGAGAGCFFQHAKGWKFNSKRVLDTDLNAKETQIHETG